MPEPPRLPDVAGIGAGIVGCSGAAFLAEAGAEAEERVVGARVLRAVQSNPCAQTIPTVWTARSSESITSTSSVGRSSTRQPVSP